MKPILLNSNELKKRYCDLNIKSALIQIRYCWWGKHPHDNRFWEGIVAVPGDGLEVGHAWDYGTKKQLIEECKKCGYEYEIIRYKRNGKVEIIESSIINN